VGGKAVRLNARFCAAALLLGVLQSTVAAQAYQQYPATQGWNQSQMRDWYELSQGSRLVPWDWLYALENLDGTPFFTRSAVSGLGYTYLSDKPDSLPVGFIRDYDQKNKSKSWLGFNCSACHTAKLKSGATEILIHGGQSMADFQTFTTGLISAVANLTKNDSAFDAFAYQVIGTNSDKTKSDRLKSELAEWLAFRNRVNETGNSSHWGRGRADAVGIILATTAAVVADPTIPTDEQEPLPASNAPVSYPFVWNANQQARLQHNGVVDNGVDFGVVKVAKIGALIRNWTEALGVFADVKLDAKGEKVVTSIRLDNLLKIEQALAGLQSPRWPEAFGELDLQRSARGQLLYKENCASCHGILDAKDTKTTLPLIEQPSAQTSGDPKGFVYLQPLFSKTTRPSDFDKSINPLPEFIGTDPGMACNALLHTVPSGQFEGKKNVTGFLPSFSNRPFADHAVTTDLLRVLIQRDILAKKVDTLQVIAENQIDAASKRVGSFVLVGLNSVFGGQGATDDPLGPLREQLKYCVDIVARARALAPDTPLPVYKARPLNGIWATAPYLHNGSVPTLYDLLLPQNDRPKSYGYFDGEMDLVKGGLKDASANSQAYIFRTFDDEGTVITGNWNGGHEYGAGITHDERLDLVEYLKGL
jgi:hypothetical protein